MRIQRNTDMLHPLLKECVLRIQSKIIEPHSIPVRLFETGRTHERHATLIERGKTKDMISGHLYNLQNDPPLYTLAVDYVYYDGKWSWNLRDSSVMAWYSIFGNLVLDTCPELSWGGYSRKSTNYNHFFLRRVAIIENLDRFPCVVP